MTPEILAVVILYTVPIALFVMGGYVKALKKQRPITPIIMPDEEYDTPVVHASCPVCGSGLGHDMSGHKANHISYCETCGQAIRWDSTKMRKEVTA